MEAGRDVCTMPCDKSLPVAYYKHHEVKGSTTPARLPRMGLCSCTTIRPCLSPRGNSSLPVIITTDTPLPSCTPLVACTPPV